MIITNDIKNIPGNTKIEINKVIEFLKSEIKKTYNGKMPEKVYIAKSSKEFAHLTGLPQNYATYYTIKELKKIGIVENTDRRGVYLLSVEKLFQI